MNIEISTYDVLYKLLKKEPYLNCLQSMQGGLLYYRECDVRIVEVLETMWCEIDDEKI